MVCSAATMKVCIANSNRPIVMPTEAVLYQTDSKLADLKTIGHKLSMAHQGHMVAVMYRPVKHTTALQVMRMEADMCRTKNRPKAILKEVLDLPKRIVDMLLQATVPHLFPDRLKPIRLRETTQRTPT
jgi:hypothetical protein